MKYKIIVSFLWFLPHELAHKLLYRYVMKKRLDLNNPKTLNEKIHWLELKYYGEKEAQLTDKLLVKDYIKSLNIKDLYIPKTYMIIEDSDNINSLTFPDKFVLKCNHGSGDVFVCNNKDEFDIDKALKKLRKVKEKNFAKFSLEYHYSLINPKIICEEYLDDGKNERPLDYKFFCFNGNVDCVMVCSDRGKDTKKDFYDKKWNHLNYSNPELWNHEKILKPDNLERLFEIASKISEGFPFVRVDLYDLNGKIYFGEMTFSPAAGISLSYSNEGDLHLGELLNLDKIKS